MRKPQFDWQLTHGIASVTNSIGLVAALLLFPMVLRWTGATEISPQGTQHTRGILKFCFVVTAFLWVCFTIALVGIRKQALLGSTILAAGLQVAIFTQGHFYQGVLRLVPVLLIGVALTTVALWRKSLIPGMIAHGLGDGLVAFLFFVKH